MTNLESLANELLLDLFGFFDTVDLLRAFHDLNSRFDGLLFTQFQDYRLDFRFTSRYNFDFLCDACLPQISDQISALRLSNDDDTPQQIEHFFLRDNLLHQFTRLKAFSLYHVYSEEIIKDISYELEHLPFLTHLSMIQCCLPHDQLDFLCIINNIWSVPTLTYYNLDIYLRDQEHFFAPTVISTSIVYVSIKGILCDCNEISLLLEYTSYLHSLEAYIDGDTDAVDLKSDFSSLITLNLSFITRNENSIMSFLRTMSNLRRLTIDMYGIYVDGYQWEQIIRSYLPNLKMFHLKEQIPIVDQNQGDEKLDTLLKSFQSQFWIDERKWFIRCDWNLADICSFISLYTLPYSFTEFTTECILKSKSTSPQNDNDQSYDQVQKLYNACSFDDTSSIRFQFCNVRHLSIEAPVHNVFLSILPRIDQLSTLNISLSDTDTTNSHLQILLNQAINLRSLAINSSSSSLSLSLIENINISVLRLNLQEGSQWFNNEQCITLMKSSLCVQCEMLAINITHCNNVLDLIDTMINLRALTIRFGNDECEDDEQNYNFSENQTDDFINWLKSCLPSTCIIKPDIQSPHNIHLWIC